MVNRHHLRIKALQALYAYFSSDDNDIAKGDKELFKSKEDIKIIRFPLISNQKGWEFYYVSMERVF